MASIINGRDDDGVEEGPSNNHGSLQKKPRTSNFIVDTPRMSNSDAGNPNPTSGARQPSLQEDNPGATDDESEELNEDESGMAFSLTDPYVLDCDICFLPLSSPVYECKNGHIACAPCGIMMMNKCASCFMPIGQNRCRALEKVLKSIKVSCRYKNDGCKNSLSYSKKLDHEKTCTYTPCSCPYPGCNYVGPSKCLYAHFTRQHSTSSTKFRYGYMFSISMGNNEKHVFLQESKESVLFILNHTIKPFLSCVSVICIGPSSLKKGFRYAVRIKDGDSSIELNTVIESTQKWIAPKKCLIVPKNFMSSDGQLKLEILINGDSE